MDTLVVGVLGIALFVVIVAFFVHSQRQLSTAAETDSSNDETSGPLSVNVVADHDEQDSLLPKFAGLLRSPWHSVSAGQKEQQKVMRPVRKGSRSMSLTMPLPLRKKREPTEVLVKKVHVPYFFPLLDETAEWWQAQQCAAGETQATPEQEPEADPESRSSEDDVSSCNRCKGDTPVSEVSAKELLQVDRPHHFAAAKMAATPIEVGGH